MHAECTVTWKQLLLTSNSSLFPSRFIYAWLTLQIGLLSRPVPALGSGEDLQGDGETQWQIKFKSHHKYQSSNGVFKTVFWSNYLTSQIKVFSLNVHIYS